MSTDSTSRTEVTAAIHLEQRPGDFCCDYASSCCRRPTKEFGVQNGERIRHWLLRKPPEQRRSTVVHSQPRENVDRQDRRHHLTTVPDHSTTE